MQQKTHKEKLEKLEELEEKTIPKFHFERWFRAKFARATIPQDKEHLTYKEAYELRQAYVRLKEAFYEGYLIGKEEKAVRLPLRAKARSSRRVM